VSRRTADWRQQAACTTHDPELFFPIGDLGPARAQIEQAPQVCQSCDVQTACLDWSQKTGADHGIWGGLSEDERRTLRLRSRRTRHPQPASTTHAS